LDYQNANNFKLAGDIRHLRNRLAYWTEYAGKWKDENKELRRKNASLERALRGSRSKLTPGLPDFYVEVEFIRDLFGYKSVRAVRMALTRKELPAADRFKKVRRVSLGGGFDYLPQWRAGTLGRWLRSKVGRGEIERLVRGS